MTRELTDVGKNCWNKLTIFHHDDGLDIAISDKLVQESEVLSFKIDALADIHEFFLAKIYDSGRKKTLSEAN